MIKIAHESPLSIMGKVQHMTDYDYALVHLFEDKDNGAEYLAFFHNALLNKREVILDNSVFELGTAFDSDRFRSWVKKLKPTYYIIPDKLRDAKATMNMVRSWEPIKGSKSMAVVQGIDKKELIECYQLLDRYVDKIAFPFNLPIYLSLSNTGDQLMDYCLGRKMFIDMLLAENIINKNKPHHLLGTVLPQEISQYKGDTYAFIESIDTSNPVVHGINGIRYTDTGLKTKLETKLYTLMGDEVTPKQWTDIKYNIKRYRLFAEGTGE